MRKMTILMSAATGYVLGARAGRERYEQICSLWGRVSSNPQVQNVAGTVSSKGATVAQTVAEKSSGVAHAVVEKAADKAPGWMPGSRDTEDTDTAAGASTVADGTATNGMPVGMSTGNGRF